MNYKDLQNISHLSQQILTESASEEHDVMNRWPYTSPYLQEERAPGVKAYKPGPTQAEVRADAKKTEKKKREAGKDKPGYGPEEKFQSDWKLRATPGSTLKRKGGEEETVSQRMDREHPYKTRMTGPMAREYGSRHAAEVTRVVKGAGEPQAVTYPRQGREEEKPKAKARLSREIIRRGKQEEGYDLYDLVLAHLIDEGFAETQEAANAIMVNMSEEWREDIIEDIRGAITYNPNTSIGRIKRRIKGSTPEKREARTRAYQGNRSDAAERYGASQRNPYDDNRGDIPSLRGH
jgi:hypothetical protein